MAGQNPGFVSQGEQAGLDRLDDLAIVTAGQVGAANAAGEEGITGHEQLKRSEMKADGALRVSRRVQHLGWELREADELAFGQGIVRRRCFRCSDAQPCSLHLHHFEQREIPFVQKDGSSGETLEYECAAHVVNVRVGNQDLLELEAEFGEAVMNSAHFVAGVDDDGFMRFFVAEDGAVAGQRANRERLQDHALIVKRRRVWGDSWRMWSAG